MMGKTTAKSMEMRGTLVWWRFDSFMTDRNELEKRLEKLGALKNQPEKKAFKGKKNSSPRTFVDLLPRNSYKSALLRSLRQLLRGDDRFYKKLKDVKESVTVPVILPIEIIKEHVVSDIKFEREVTVVLDKKTGKLSFNQETPFNTVIEEEYKKMMKLFDTEQLSALLTHIVKEECFGVSIKLGVYYIPEMHLEKLEILQRIVNYFEPDQIELFQVPVYNDQATQRAVQAAIEDDMLDKIDKLKEEFAKLTRSGKLSRELRGNRLTEIMSLIKRARTYKKDLASKAASIDGRLLGIEEKIGKYDKFGEEAAKDEGFLTGLLSM